MTSLRVLLALVLVALVATATSLRQPADAQGQTIKIGVLFDHTGPFSAAGSLNCYRGAKMIIDYINEKGGVLGKYKIVQVDGDSQSKAEAAINEAERLLNVEKVDILAGVYSSAHAVPLAEKVDKQQKFLWITTAIADAVLKDRNLQYTFRPQPNGGLFGENSVQYVAHYAQEQLKKAPRDVRVAIIYEDGPYGTGVAAANEAEAKKQGMQEMLKRYKTFEPSIPAGQVAPHVSMGFNNMWILLNDVLPRAIQKHGGFSAEALAKAARETDIPEGGTMQGYGVKFHPLGHAMAGQNMRAIAAVFQVVDGDFKHVYPPVVASMSAPPVLLPASSPLFAR